MHSRHLTKLALAKRKRDGKRVGTVPYESTLSRGRVLRPNAQEQEAIRLMVEMRDRGSSFRQIVQELTRLGHKPKVAAIWYPKVVRDIILRVQANG